MAAQSIHQRVCNLIISLAGHEVNGVRNSELADALRVSRATISRDLAALEEIGITEQIPGLKERWRLGPKMIQVSRAHQEGMARIRHAVEEIDQRYSRQQ